MVSLSFKMGGESGAHCENASQHHDIIVCFCFLLHLQGLPPGNCLGLLLQRGNRAGLWRCKKESSEWQGKLPASFMHSVKPAFLHLTECSRHERHGVHNDSE